MTATPKRRWYQFSLRTLMLLFVILSVGIGSYVAWQRHRHYCISQVYRFMDDAGEDGGYAHSLYFCDEPYTQEETYELALVNEQRDQLAEAYLHAIYRPWERISIGPEPRGPKRPERFAERLKTSSNAADRDAQLHAIEHPSKRKRPPDFYPYDPPRPDPNRPKVKVFLQDPP